MAQFSFGSLRVRSILLVIVSILPLFGLTFYSGMEERRQSRARAFQEALNLSQNIANVENQLINEVRHTLLVISQMFQTHAMEPEESMNILSDLLLISPAHSGFILAGPDGEILTSVPRLSQPLNISGRPYFKRLLQTKDFVLGEYQIGGITGKAVLPLAYPILDKFGNIKAVLVTGLDLNWLGLYLTKINLPPKANIHIIDRKGTILLRYPYPEGFIGKSLPEVAMIKTILEKGEGVVEAPGLKGTPHLIGFSSFGYPSGVVSVSVGIPKQVAFAEANKSTVRNMAWLMIVAMLGLFTAWFGGEIFIIRIVNRLLGKIKAMTSGDLTARVGAPYGRGEIAQLAQSFDQMAETLQERMAEINRAAEELRKSEDRLQLQIERMPIGLIVWDLDFHVVSWNPAAEGIFGYTASEASGRHPYGFIVPKDAQPPVDTIWSRLTQGDETAHIINENITKEGHIIICSWFNTPLKGADGKVNSVLSMVQDITARKHMEEALRESEEKYRTLFEQSKDAIYITSPDGKLLDCNQSYLDLFGYDSVEEAKSVDITNMYVDLNERLKIRKEVRTTGFSKDYEVKLKKKDGRVIDCLVNANLRWAGDGRILGHQGVISDITERKRVEEMLRRAKEELELKVVERTAQLQSAYQQLEVELGDRKLAEEALRQSEIRLTDAQRVAKLGSWEWDIINNKITWSEEFYRIFGLTHQEFEATYEAFLDYVHPEDRENLDKAMKETVYDKRSYSIYHRFIRKEGTVGEMHSLGERIYDESGRPIMMRGTGQDITELKETKEKLVTSEKRFYAIFENTPLGILIIDKNRRFTDCNTAFRRMIGYDLAELGSMSVSDIVYTDDDGIDVSFYKEMMKGDIDDFTMEKRFIRKDGTILWGNVTVALIRNQENEPQFVFGILEDITERKGIEGERERLIFELQQAAAKVRTLSGLLPICASCKKIRDDKGYWNQIEAYISEHSEAEFSHGICPDCLKILYPDYYNKNYE